MSAVSRFPEREATYLDPGSRIQIPMLPFALIYRIVQPIQTGDLAVGYHRFRIESVSADRISLHHLGPFEPEA
jgi:hypothetical protein